MGDFADEEPVFYEAEFCRKTGQEDDEDFIYEGFSYGGNKTSEGVSLPYFTKETTLEIANDLLSCGRVLVYEKDCDVFRYVDKTMKIHTFKGEDIKVNDWEGGSYTEHVYPIGHNILPDFAWAEVVKSWIYVSRAQCPYCGHEFGDVNNTCEECGREVNF